VTSSIPNSPYYCNKSRSCKLSVREGCTPIRAVEGGVDSLLTPPIPSDTVPELDLTTRSQLQTSAHLTYFLSTLYTNDTPGAASYAAWAGAVPPVVANRTSLAPDPSYQDQPPTLVILHNPSDYLAEEQAQQ
jgi:hypothetical protein